MSKTNIKKREVVFQKILGIILILCGIIPFAVLPTVAFTGYGSFTFLHRHISFVELLRAEAVSNIWAITSWAYWSSFFIGAIIVAYGIVLCVKKDNPFFKKNRIALLIVKILNALYSVVFIINIIMVSRIFATISFYIYTISIFLIIIILTYVLAQKNNKNSKQQENIK
ncbi:MAG: hypothetical protein FWE03_02720 [Firmicutes bacterium]|nr:hypothetical protein [Bacillota bacterium]